MDIFTRFKAAIKIREVYIDNNVFQLHYRVTAILLLGCAALVASKQHFGDPIDCITRDDVPNKIMDTYCWIHSTFTLPDACNRTVGTEVAHPCVDKSEFTKDERIYHKYYQWVYFVLFFQALCFYAPHFFWKACEGQLLKKLTQDMRDPLFRKTDKEEHANQVALYLKRNRTRHQKYYYYFTLFELVNFLNVILQVRIVDEFLGGTFTTYGLDVLNYIQLDQESRVDPMVKVFPRMTKCTFHRFGSSGDVQRHDALCILPLNIINEKIYIIMWFWFLFLAIVSGLWLVYRLLTFINPQMRHKLLHRRANYTTPRVLKVVLANADPGHWFLLTMMCKNMDAQWFRFVMRELARLLNEEQMELGRLDLKRRQNNHLKRPTQAPTNKTRKAKTIEDQLSYYSDAGTDSDEYSDAPRSDDEQIDIERGKPSKSNRKTSDGSGGKS